MKSSELLKKTRARRETAIEDAIMAYPEVLGFPGALAIRNCRISMPTGRVDVVLLPRDGSVRLVLIEAKASVAQDAASKVVGQLVYMLCKTLRSSTLSELKAHRGSLQKC